MIWKCLLEQLPLHRGQDFAPASRFHASGSGLVSTHGQKAWLSSQEGFAAPKEMGISEAQKENKFLLFSFAFWFRADWTDFKLQIHKYSFFLGIVFILFLVNESWVSCNYQESRDFGWNREHQESNDKSLTGPITGSEVCGDTRALGPRNEILCIESTTLWLWTAAVMIPFFLTVLLCELFHYCL